MRNLLALSCGVRRTACWNLAPDIPGYENPLSIMDLLFGKLALMDYQGAELRHRHPAAETFALLADQLAGVDRVTRLEVPERPGVFLFEVHRGGRGPLLVVWDRRDSFHGEEEPPSPSTGPGRHHRPRPSTPWVRRDQPTRRRPGAPPSVGDPAVRHRRVMVVTSSAPTAELVAVASPPRR